MSLAELMREQTRLMILQLLAQAPGYEANDNLLATMLGEVGHSISRDALRVQMAWLEEQGLVNAKTLLGVMRVASLTPRGQDVAKGLSVIPGVRRPDPEGDI